MGFIDHQGSVREREEQERREGDHLGLVREREREIKVQEKRVGEKRN